MIDCASLSSVPAQSGLNKSEQLRSQVSPETVIRINEPLGRKTTLRVGGPADMYVEPASTADLSAVVKWCREESVPLFVLGRGSNLLVRDQGYRGVVVCLTNQHFSQINVAGQHLSCAAGARLKAVAMEAKRHELTGLEFMEGIPGTVGGGLRMNAGAMGVEMFQSVESVRLMDLNGMITERTPIELEIHYRSCPTLKTHLALGAVLRGEASSRQIIQTRMDEYSRKRWSSQPAAASAGCIFKNPLTIPAGKLIEELGLKGTRVGGAYISAEHGNFIVNDGTATGHDVLELIDLIQQRARAERGIELQTEVEIIGN
jgi:UDP-N-acetylenolpyruvoylglucosamine reductase